MGKYKRLHTFHFNIDMTKYNIITYYDNNKEPCIKNYYDKLKRELCINEKYINTLYEDRMICENIINNPNKSTLEKRMAKYAIIGMTSSASNDIFEEQISKILNNTDITHKHGWDGYNKKEKEPYEYKPTKIIAKKYLTSNVNINDDSYNKIHNISIHKLGYNNYDSNFVIVPINKDTSEIICIYKFKEYILHKSRIDNIEKPRGSNQRCVYGTNIKKCIELSNKYNEIYYYWHNSKFIP